MLKRLKKLFVSLSTDNAEPQLVQTSSTLKVKLVAIAKDEGAYLPDWLFHHLYFGFDKVVVYINNTTDNSWELASLLNEESRIEFKNGDEYFQQSKRAPQNLVYETELLRSNQEGFSHVMFLDIDEFFVPINFRHSIKDMIKALNADICCLEWALRVDEHSVFSAPFDGELKLNRARQIKSIAKTGLDIKQVNQHNIFVSGANYKLANGAPFMVDDPSRFSLVPDEEMSKPLKPFFILHRIIRHEIEYIAALSRGRPIQSGKQASMFKDNRGGILSDAKAERLSLPSNEIERYETNRLVFFKQYKLDKLLEQSKQLVLQRYQAVIKQIKNAPIGEAKTLQKVLKNVTIPEVLNAYHAFKQRNKQKH